MNLIAWSQALLELWRYCRSFWYTCRQVHPRHEWHTCSGIQLSCDICCCPSSLQTPRCCSSLDCNLGSSGPRCSSGWICPPWPIQPGWPALRQQHGKAQCLVGWWYYVLDAPFKAFNPWQHCVFEAPSGTPLPWAGSPDLSRRGYFSPVLAWAHSFMIAASCLVDDANLF